MKLIQSVAPTAEPVTLAEMKIFLRILHLNDDDLISSMIMQARESAELIMNRQIMPCEYELYFDVMQNEITLPRPPFVNLVSFQAFDGTNWNDVTHDLDDKSTQAILYVSEWPLISSTKNSVKIVYKAGYADAASVPETIKAWIKIQVSTYYEFRESFVFGSISKLPGEHVDSLLTRHKVHNL